MHARLCMHSVSLQVIENMPLFRQTGELFCRLMSLCPLCIDCIPLHMHVLCVLQHTLCEKWCIIRAVGLLPGKKKKTKKQTYHNYQVDCRARFLRKGVGGIFRGVKIWKLISPHIASASVFHLFPGLVYVSICCALGFTWSRGPVLSALSAVQASLFPLKLIKVTEMIFFKSTCRGVNRRLYAFSFTVSALTMFLLCRHWNRDDLHNLCPCFIITMAMMNNGAAFMKLMRQ